MILKHPFLISSRLLPAVAIDGAYIQVEPFGQDPQGKPRWKWYIDLPNRKSFSGDDLYGFGGVQKTMEVVLDFLSSFAEAKSIDSDSWDLFPDGLREWARHNSDEIQMLAIELAETPNLVVES